MKSLNAQYQKLIAARLSITGKETRYMHDMVKNSPSLLNLNIVEIELVFECTEVIDW